MVTRSCWMLFCAPVIAWMFFAISANAQQPTPTETKAAEETKTTAVIKPTPLAPVKPAPECSLSKTNTKCVLIVDRSNPVSPSTVQMYSGESVTVIVENPKPFERYFLDYQSGQATLQPDVASSIIQAMLPALGKLQVSSTEATTPHIAAPLISPCQAPQIKNPLKPSEIAKALPKFQD